MGNLIKIHIYDYLVAPQTFQEALTLANLPIPSWSVLHISSWCHVSPTQQMSVPLEAPQRWFFGEFAVLLFSFLVQMLE